MSGNQPAGGWTPLDGTPMPESNSLLDLAKQYVTAGLSVIAIRVDGSKAPSGAEWKKYQKRQANPAELQLMFHGKHGIAILGGRVSGNLEIMDFDKPGVFELWNEYVLQLDPEFGPLLSRLPRVRTPAGGAHLYYRCSEISGSVKLARAAEPFVDCTGKKKTTLIEIKGEAGYVLAPGCPAACHEANRLYDLLYGSLNDVPTITPTQRQNLHSAAMALNQVASEENRPQPTTAAGKRPGDEFNARGPSWAQILEPHGWERRNGRGDTEYWRRPGKKDKGISATTGHCGNMLYVFSSNAQPFDADRAYDKFRSYALLDCSGDFKEAARRLARDGFGAKKEQTRTKGLRLEPFVGDLISKSKRLGGLFNGRGRTCTDEGGERLPTTSTGYDLSLAIELAKKGVDNVDAIAGAIWERPDDAVKLRGEDYARGVAREALDLVDGDVAKEQYQIEDLKVYDSDPPSYKLVVNGTGIRMSTNELLNPPLFRKRVLERTRQIPDIPSKPAVWHALVNQWLRKAEVIELPPEASADTMLRERIAYTLKGLPRGETFADLERGRAVPIDDGLAFRTRPFMDILNGSSDSKRQVEANDLCRHLKAMGYKSTTKRLADNENPVRVWLADLDD